MYGSTLTQSWQVDMKKLTLAEARREVELIKLWVWRQEHWNSKIQPHGGNIVSDHDEDYVFDALFDVPNR